VIRSFILGLITGFVVAVLVHQDIEPIPAAPHREPVPLEIEPRTYAAHHARRAFSAQDEAAAYLQAAKDSGDYQEYGCEECGFTFGGTHMDARRMLGRHIMVNHR
jgi:hypothetical protein